MNLKKLLLTLTVLNNLTFKKTTQEYKIKIQDYNYQIRTLIQNTSFKTDGENSSSLPYYLDTNNCRELCNSILQNLSKLIILENKNDEIIDETAFNESKFDESKYDRIRELSFSNGVNNYRADEFNFGLECIDCYYYFDQLIFNKDLYFVVKKKMLDNNLI